MEIKAKVIPFNKRNVWITLALLVLGIALNLVLSQLVRFLGVPLFFDCVGTILVAFLGGLFPAVMVGFLSNVVIAFFDPPLLYYCLVNVLIAWAAYLFAKKKVYRRFYQLLFAALIFSLIGGGFGALITSFLCRFRFGDGNFVPLAHFFLEHFIHNQFLAQVLAEIILNFLDKVPVFLIALLLYRLIPEKWKMIAAEPFLTQNSLPMKRTLFRHSLLSKVVIIVLVAEGLLGTFACSISFFLYRTIAMQNFINIANGITSSATLLIDPNKIDLFIKEGKSNPEYLDVEKKLYTLRDGFPNATYLYVYRIEKDGCRVVFDLNAGDGIDPNMPGDLVEFDPSFEAFLPALFKGDSIDPVV